MKEKIIKDVGGMALFDGLMLRSKLREVIAERDSKGSISLEINNYEEEEKKFYISDLPIIRGMLSIFNTIEQSIPYLINSVENELNSDNTNKDDKINFTKTEAIATICFIISMAIIFLILVPNIIGFVINKNIANIIECIIEFSVFAIYLLILKSNESLGTLYKYHGAEHKVVNAYEKYGKDNITIDNVKKSSRFHVRCGGNFIIYFVVCMLLTTLFIPTENIIYKSLIQIGLVIPLIGVSFEILMVFSKLPFPLKYIAYPAMLIQFITTKEPSDDMIELAICAIKPCINKNIDTNLVEYIDNYKKDVLIKNNIEFDIDDIYRLVAFIKKCTLNTVIIDKDKIVLNYVQKVKLDELLNKYYIQKIPLQYITHVQAFYNEEYAVSENVLIPRSDTEILVEKVIEYVEKYQLKDMIDMCTGSGCIGISCAKNSNIEKVLMVDISDCAIVIANKNIDKNDARDKCIVAKSNLFEALERDRKFDIIVSNPPYIKTGDISTLDEYVKKEPIIALDGGNDGMEFYKKIVENSVNYINDGGFLMLEIGYDELDDVTKIISKYNEYEVIESVKDYGGKDRVIICRFHQI